MATRQVTGVIRTPLGEPWPDFELDFTIEPTASTLDATYPHHTVTITTGADGTFAVDLEIGVRYQVGLRGAYDISGSYTGYTHGRRFPIVVPDGEGPISLATLQALDATPPADPTVADFAANHMTDTANPHAVTAQQVGAYTTGEVDALLDDVTADTAWGGITGMLADQADLAGALGDKAATADLTAHTGRTDNPHGVDKGQVGLGNVDDTSDADKPVSTAQQAALAAKAAAVHTHAIADVTGLQDALDDAGGMGPPAVWGTNYTIDTRDNGGMQVPAANNTSPIAPGTIRLVRIVVPDDAPVKGIIFEVTTASTAGTARVGIFTVDHAARTASLVLDASTISTATTGVKEVAFAHTLVAGEYWLAVASSEQFTIRSFAPLGSFARNGWLSQPFRCYSATAAYGPFASSYPVTGQYGGIDTPILALRRA